MNSNFARALAAVLLHEGGFSNHPSDPGGATNRGITIATFRKWVKANGTVEDLKNISAADVAKVYRKHYWNAVSADDLPGGIDFAVFDYAVNSGPTRAAKALQGVLGVTVDGKIGPETIAAAKAANPVAVVNALCDQRLAFLKGLKTWGTFGKGWGSRVENVRDDAIQLTATAPTIPVEPDKPIPPKPTPPPAQPADRGPAVVIALFIGAVLAGIGMFATAAWDVIVNLLKWIF